MSSIDTTLQERGSRYGEFDEHASVTQGIKEALRRGRNWEVLADDMKEAMEMTAHKFGRILNGDPEYIDSWTDVIGYNRLVEKRLLSDVEARKENPAKSNVESIRDALYAAEAQARQESAPCTDPTCPIHNESIQQAIETLSRAGFVVHA